MEKYTREDLVSLMAIRSVEGRISPNDLASIVLDNRFPDELFIDGSNEIIEYRENKQKLSSLVKILELKMNLFKETKTQKRRDELMEEMDDMNAEIDTIFDYFNTILKENNIA